VGGLTVGFVLFVVVIKLLPALLVIGGVSLGGLLLAGCLIVAAIAVLAALGLSVIAAVLAVALVVAVGLSPIWVPVLAVLGIIALVKKATRTTA
jgi:hypothetical protein